MEPTGTLVFKGQVEAAESALSWGGGAGGGPRVGAVLPYSDISDFHF